ncbi:ABC transporter substrate-binding protein [Agromyces silvae]|uniref:ABC transporter substrate-binding protein n=1 Tax=Agromyces silvae TaxID=3388266 RepID=UPI00280BA53D|nr:extracellular solute-binding protein [Agromyces protaetiae]
MRTHGNGAISVRPRMNAVRRRTLVAAITTTTALAVLAGCASPGASTSSGDLSEDGPLSITWYGSDARNAAVQEVVDGFAAQAEGVDVQTQPTTFEAYWDRLSVQSSGNTMACVVAMQSRYEARYEARGSLLVLDDLIADGTIDVSGIPDEVLESQRASDGNLYVIPFGIWYEGATLNIPFIEQSGLAAPDADTWEDYLEWGAAAVPAMPDGVWPLTDRGGEVTQFQAFAIERGENLFEDDGIGFSADTLVDWLELWSGAIEDGVVPPAGTTAEQVGVPTAQTLVAQGRAMVSSTGDNNISDIQLTLDQNGLGTVSIAPSPTGTKPQVVGTNGWAISSNCGNTKQATAFIDYFVNSDEGATILQAQTGLPPVSSVLDSQIARPETSAAIKERAALYQQLLADGAVVDVWPDATQQLVTQFRTAYEEVAFGRMSAEDSAETFIEQAEAALSGF